MVVFLDIDGILNTRRSRSLYGRGYIDPESVAVVERFCRASGAVVVLSTAWRLHYIHGFGATVRDLRAAGLTVPIVGATPDLETRGDEIRAWLAEHPGPFVILDDKPVDGFEVTRLDEIEGVQWAQEEK